MITFIKVRWISFLILLMELAQVPLYDEFILFFSDSKYCLFSLSLYGHLNSIDLFILWLFPFRLI